MSENWKEMRKQFRNIDKDGTGKVAEIEFRQILRQFNINLSEDEFEQLISNYDCTSSGKIGYNEFIKHFIV